MAQARSSRSGRSRRSRSTAPTYVRGVTQGALAPVHRAWGGKSVSSVSSGSTRSTRRPRRGRRAVVPDASLSFDAFHPMHLPLPRAMAPYTVIRTTEPFGITLSSDEPTLIVLGPQTTDSPSSRDWSSIFGYIFKGATLDATAGSILPAFTAMTADSWKGARITPAAFSAQMMCSNALQSAGGVIYAGRAKNAYFPQASASISTANAGGNLVAYSNPRMLTMGKLALRGVQVNSVPCDMNALANFTDLNQAATGEDATFSETYGRIFEGFNPVFFYIPGGAGTQANPVTLQFLVACEWRVRFDPSNPAYASVSHHGSSTESLWSSTMSSLGSQGHGVIDTLSQVAEYGAAAAAMASSGLPQRIWTAARQLGNAGVAGIEMAALA